jgi:hypothetical protein
VVKKERELKSLHTKERKELEQTDTKTKSKLKLTFCFRIIALKKETFIDIRG